MAPSYLQQAPAPTPRRLLSQLLLLLIVTCDVLCAVQYDAIQSKRGVQPKSQWISDDFVVGCIMIMFLLLFCFGKQ